MPTVVYRYSFQDGVPIEDVEAMLVLALLGVESLHGPSQARLDAGHYLDSRQRVCVIDGSTQLGLHLNQLFVGFLGREFPPDAFCIERMVGDRPSRSHRLEPVSAEPQGYPHAPSL